MKSGPQRIAAATLAVFLVACAQGGTDPSPTATPELPASATQAVATSAPPTASPSATATDPEETEQATAPTPTATPTGLQPVVAPPTDILPPGSIARVVVDAVRIREGPGTSSPVVTTAGRGEAVYITALGNSLSPRFADGLEWYLVFFSPGWTAWPIAPGTADTYSNGWVARAQAGTTFIELEPVTCTTATPDLRTLGAMTPWARLACYGNAELTISGYAGCPGGGGCGGYAVGTFTPEWLAYPFSDVIRPELGPSEPTVGYRIDPATGLAQPAQDQMITATGHHDDPASSSCVIEPEPMGPAHPSAVVLFCREQFVLSSYE